VKLLLRRTLVHWEVGQLLPKRRLKRNDVGEDHNISKKDAEKQTISFFSMPDAAY